jgi:hypothetical protein
MSVCVAFTSFKEIQELLDGAHEALKSQHGLKSWISSVHWLHIYQLNQGSTKFWKSGNHLKFLGARKVIWNRFFTDDQ